MTDPMFEVERQYADESHLETRRGVWGPGPSGLDPVDVAMPVIARNVLESVRLLAACSRVLAERCVDGITADAERMRRYAESSPSVVTPLNKHIGYEAAAKVA